MYFKILKTFLSLAKRVNKDLAQNWILVFRLKMPTFEENSNSWATYFGYF